ncbi:Ger(x)C family spore germination protein [Sutcliffiella halmapala]|uniref:Ger(x)C family spore germination protein n=1 Tax=Sutcliffiella halmapala TaxID=79882 RepID=UPI000995CA6B|nr:Ger(x)C family spore germination protein [Sutcliffiella halmapala]
MINRKLIGLLSCFLLLVGCLEQKPLEELGLLTATGYDKEEDDLIRGSIVYYEFDPLHPNNSKMVSTVANTSKGIRQKENLASSRKLVSGQLRVAVYGQELAKEGIISYIDTLSRDSEIGTMSYLAVSNTTAHELLSRAQESDDIANAGTYLYDLISQNVQSESLVSPTLHEFMQCYYSQGRDPALPYMEFRGNTIFVNGLALFKDDRMVGNIDTTKSFYLKLLLNPYRAGNIEISFPKDKLDNYLQKRKHPKVEKELIFASLDHLESDVRIEMENVNPLTFSIEVDVVTRMQEISEDYDLGNPEALKEIEKVISATMKAHIEELIKEFQMLTVDPIGFGNHYRAKIGSKNFTREKWRKLYPETSFNIKVETKILRTGVMD